jgi:3-isopropylmalate/(R)-2-methylmalate dehydratase small subunit
MSIDPLRVVASVAAVLDQPNIDTDVIIRIERMVSTDPSILAPWAFEALRYRLDGSPNPDFVLNQAPFDRAEILVTGSNFGCGSSREPAVWAIKGLGIRVIIAPSFGDIFRANCHQNGLLPIALHDEDVHAVATLALAGKTILVDLEARRITADNHAWSFAIGDTQRHSLLEGLDDLDLALRDIDRVRSWEKSDRAKRGWAWQSLSGASRERRSWDIPQGTSERTT